MRVDQFIILGLLYLGTAYFVAAMLFPGLRFRTSRSFRLHWSQEEKRLKAEEEGCQGPVVGPVTCFGFATLLGWFAFTAQAGYPPPLWILGPGFAAAIFGWVIEELSKTV